jgi:alpha-glucosidase (family GH31 glycosyl hydrolase)
MAKQLDFLVTTFPAAARGPPLSPTPPTTAAAHTVAVSPFASILNNYYTAIGLPPPLPDWALGFWASKQRYVV